MTARTGAEFLAPEGANTAFHGRRPTGPGIVAPRQRPSTQRAGSLVTLLSSKSINPSSSDFKQTCTLGDAGDGPGKSLCVHFQVHGCCRAKIRADGVGYGDGVKKRGRIPVFADACLPLVVEKRQLVGKRRAVGKILSRSGVSRRIWVESSGIMKIGTPDASSAWAPAISPTMFHSGAG